MKLIQEGSASALSQLPFHRKNVSTLRALSISALRARTCSRPAVRLVVKLVENGEVRV
jgi:hypothetical protein